MAPSIEEAQAFYEAAAKQGYQHAKEALERLKSGAKPAPQPEKKKEPEKKEKKPEKGGFFKGLFGGRK